MNGISEKSLHEHSDFYLKIRERINRWQEEGALVKKRGNWTDHFVQYLFILPDMFHLMVRLLIDSETPARIRGYIAIALGYLVCPLDVMPDFIPVVGLLDDLVVTVVFLNKIINSRDENMVKKINLYWAGEQDIFSQVREITALLNELSSHLPKGIYNFIKRKP